MSHTNDLQWCILTKTSIEEIELQRRLLTEDKKEKPIEKKDPFYIPKKDFYKNSYEAWVG